MKSIRNLTISSLFKVFTIVLIAFFATGVSTNAQQKEKTISDFRVKGFHLDLRIQVMTMPALKEFAKELADFGMNTLVMEWEGTYPYEKHATISNKYAYTRDEVKEFVAYCDSLGIDVIPLQQCFGHVEYILRHGRYNHLRESRNDLSQVCPLKVAGNKQLFTELFKDMAMLHTSEYIHIGGDETRLLGHCAQCSKKVAAEGTSKLFSDYLIMLCNQVVALGKKPVIWADMVLKYPDVVDYLPKETVYVDWNYGWDINYFGNVGDLLKKDANFWGAPAIRSHPDNWYSIDWEKHFNNLRNYIPYAREAGYQGIVMTSWSTSGVYGYTWDTNMEVIDLHAMRNVYPLSGFRILIAAYVQALNQSEPLDPENFVKKYAKHRFGLKKEGGEGLWSVLRTSQKIIKFQNPSDTQELDSINKMVKQAEKVMAAIKPSKHQKEFEHLKLMLDMRSFYLDIKKVESFYESGQYTSATAKDLLPELERLLVGSKILDDRFMQLNEGYLYPEEIKEQNEIRNRQLQNLYEAVTKARTGLESLRQANFPQRIKKPTAMPSRKNFWIFIMAGQSNMAGRGIVEPRDTMPNPRILTLGPDNKWVVAKEPLHLYQPQLTGLDCGLSFANELLKHVGDSVTIGLIPCAVGGTKVESWLNDSEANGIRLFSNFKEKAAVAMKNGEIKGVLWHQGESDANPINLPYYKQRLESVFTNMRNFIGDDSLPIIIGELGAYVRNEKWKVNWGKINEILHSLTEESKCCYPVSTSDLDPNPDFIHFNSASQRIIGKRYAEKFININRDCK